MYTPEQATRILNALRLGRKKRPEKIDGELFRNDKAACALGAIAIGLGIPDNLVNDYLHPTKDADQDKAYNFVKDTLGLEFWSDISSIYSVNDDTVSQGGHPDQAVIEYIKENTVGISS